MGHPDVNKVKEGQSLRRHIWVIQGYLAWKVMVWWVKIIIQNSPRTNQKHLMPGLEGRTKDNTFILLASSGSLMEMTIWANTPCFLMSYKRGLFQKVDILKPPPKKKLLALSEKTERTKLRPTFHEAYDSHGHRPRWVKKHLPALGIRVLLGNMCSKWPKQSKAVPM